MSVASVGAQAARKSVRAGSEIISGAVVSIYKSRTAEVAAMGLGDIYTALGQPTTNKFYKVINKEAFSSWGSFSRACEAIRIYVKINFSNALSSIYKNTVGKAGEFANSMVEKLGGGEGIKESLNGMTSIVKAKIEQRAAFVAGEVESTVAAELAMAPALKDSASKAASKVKRAAKPKG